MNRTIFLNKAHSEEVLINYFNSLNVERVDMKEKYTFMRMRHQKEAIEVLKFKAMIIDGVFTKVSMARHWTDLSLLSPEDKIIVTAKTNPLVPQPNVLRASTFSLLLQMKEQIIKEKVVQAEQLLNNQLRTVASFNQNPMNVSLANQPLPGVSSNFSSGSLGQQLVGQLSGPPLNATPFNPSGSLVGQNTMPNAGLLNQQDLWDLATKLNAVKYPNQPLLTPIAAGVQPAANVNPMLALRQPLLPQNIGMTGQSNLQAGVGQHLQGQSSFNTANQLPTAARQQASQVQQGLFRQSGPVVPQLSGQLQFPGPSSVNQTGPMFNDLSQTGPMFPDLSQTGPMFPRGSQGWQAPRHGKPQ